MLKKLFKKSLYYFITLVGGKLLTAAFFVLLARILQPANFGLVSFFITIVQIVTVLADAGLKSWYQKQMAHHRDSLLLAGVLCWRLIFYLLSVIIIVISLWFYPWLSYQLLGFVLLALLLESFVSVSDSFYLCQGKSLYLGYKLIARNCLLFTALLWVHGPNDYVSFLWVYLVTLALVVIFYFPYRALHWRSWCRARRLPVIRDSLVYAQIDGLGIVYSRADSLIIQTLRGNSALGIYSAAYRYLDAFNLIPQALFHNLFPLAAKPNGITYSQLRKMVIIMTSIGLLVAGGLFISSDLLTTWLLGESYAPAAGILRAFTPVIILFFFNAPLNTIIQSSHQARRYVPYLTAITLINLLLNCWWVVKWGLWGAVAAMTICEALLVLVNIYLTTSIYFLRPSRSVHHNV